MTTESSGLAGRGGSERPGLIEVENVAHGEPPREAARLLILAPNWLGDAVMALPAVADIRRAWPHTALTVAARPAVAPLFTMVPGIDAVTAPDAIAAGSFDAALLLTNSFHSALTVWKAAVRERWGYRRDFRGPLLTRAVTPPYGLHQAAYYQHLVSTLGFEAGPLEPVIEVPEQARRAAADLLQSTGWDRRQPLVALAAGAAYGGAKRWPSTSYAELARLFDGEDTGTVLVGNAADRPSGDAIVTALQGSSGSCQPIDLIGRTDLVGLAGVLTQCRALVSNDSGAAHLGAALGLDVTVLFGPTDERATRPLGRRPPTLLVHDVWCRPCMLRECPLTHACMRGLHPQRVVRAARRSMQGMLDA
jgi:heptosyltransferase-2